MGLIKNIRRRWTEPVEFVENRGAFGSLANPSNEFIQFMSGGQTSDAGVVVSPEMALKNMGLYAAITTIVEPLSHMPIPLIEIDGDNRIKRKDHPVHKLLNAVFNDEHHSMEGREMLFGHYLLRGNAFAQILRTRSGKPAQLWVLHPDRMRVERRSGQLFYIYTTATGSEVVLPKSDILHLRNLTNSDGLLGVGFIQLAGNALGLSVATEKYASKLYQQGARPSGVIKHPAKLGDKTMDRLRKQFTELYAGIENYGKMAILEEGMEWQKLGLSAEEAQIMQSRKFQIEEIARGLRVPGHKVGLLDKATFSNIEHQNLEFIVFTLMGHARRFEYTVVRDLLSEQERGILEPKYNFNSLSRGDIKTRSEAYAIGRQWGWLSADDIRELEDQDPLPDGQGKIYLIPLNMVDAKRAQDVQDAGAAEPAPAQDPQGRKVKEDNFRPAIRQAFMVTLIDGCDRLVRKEVKAIGNILKSSSLRGTPEDFRKKAEAFYQELERDAVQIFESLGESVGFMLAESEVDRRAVKQKTLDAALEQLRLDRDAILLQDFSRPEEAYRRISGELDTFATTKTKALADKVIEAINVDAQEVLNKCA